MQTRAWLASAVLSPSDKGGGPPKLSDAMDTLAQERTYAEFGAGMLKAHAADDFEGRRLYAEAKAAFDGLIEQLLTDLAQNRDPALSPAFRQRLDEAVTKRVSFSEHADRTVKARLPQGAKPLWLDALAQIPADLIKALFDGGLSIWHEWRSAAKDRRDQIASRLEAQRWKPFADVAPAS